MTDFSKDEVYINNMNKNARSHLKKATTALKDKDSIKCLELISFANKFFDVCPYYEENKYKFNDTFKRAMELVDPSIIIENINALVDKKTGGELLEILGISALMSIIYETSIHTKRE